jgi:ATP-dependent DNA ligase
MLAKPAAMPRRPSSYAYEPKWDGFRALLSTEHGLRILSRRRWNMTPLLPELEAFPVRGVFDGELIAFSEGQPDFVALCDRMLLRSELRISVAFVVFDVLSLEGTKTMREPYWRRPRSSRPSTWPAHTGPLRPRSRTAPPSGALLRRNRSRAW